MSLYSMNLSVSRFVDLPVCKSVGLVNVALDQYRGIYFAKY